MMKMTVSNPALLFFNQTLQLAPLLRKLATKHHLMKQSVPVKWRSKAMRKMTMLVRISSSSRTLIRASLTHRI